MKRFDIVVTEHYWDVGCVAEVNKKGKPTRVWARYAKIDDIYPRPNGQMPEYGGVELLNWIKIGEVHTYKEWHDVSFDKTTEEIVTIIEDRYNPANGKLKRILNKIRKTITEIMQIIRQP